MTTIKAVPNHPISLSLATAAMSTAVLCAYFGMRNAEGEMLVNERFCEAFWPLKDFQPLLKLES